jgi:hypothetical protein
MINRRKRIRKTKKVNQYLSNKSNDEQANVLKLGNKKKDRNINIELSNLNLIPQKLDSKSTHIPQNNLMEADIIPKHPFSGLFIGQSGAGKTNTMIYIFNNFYKNYFDEIYVFGQTTKSDAMYKHFNDLKEDNIKTSNLESELDTLLDKMKSEAEKDGPENIDRRLVVIEDATSEAKLTNSKSFIKFYVQARHLNCSIVCNIHKIRSINRAARINAVALFLFKPSSSDFQIFVDEYRPPKITKKQFIEMLNYIFSPSDDMVKPFLYYNRNLPIDIAFRKGFHELVKPTNKTCF